MADDAVHHPGDKLGFDVTVSVAHQRTPSGKVELDSPPMVIRAHLLPPEAASPAIVVASRNGQPHPLADDFPQARKNWKNASGNHGSVLKPEFKEVAVEDQVPAQLRNVDEKTLEGHGNGIAWTGADMGVGNDDGCMGVGWHWQEYTDLPRKGATSCHN